MDVASAFVACDEPAEAVDPGEAALDRPPAGAQLLAGLDAAAAMRAIAVKVARDP